MYTTMQIMVQYDFFLRNNFNQQGHIQLIKSDSKDVYRDVWTESWTKSISFYKIILNSTTVFNLEQQISIFKWFLKIMWHWRF